MLFAFVAMAACHFLAGAFFWFSKNAALKRRLLPYIGIVFVCLTLGLLLESGFPTNSLYVFAPFILLVVGISLRTFQFCDSCGATVRSGAFSQRPAYCPKCGASMQQVTK